MRAFLLELLRCPNCERDPLSTDGSDPETTKVLRCPGCGASYAVRDGIPELLLGDSVLARPADGPAPDARVLRGTGAAEQRAYWESDSAHRPVDHPMVKAFAEQRWRHLSRLFPLDRISTALDVGSGSGFSTLYLPRTITPVACDGSRLMLQRNPCPDRVLVDAQVLPFKSEAFDLVFCWELLHHVAEPWRAVAEMARVSRRWVVWFEPNPLNVAQFLFALADPEHRWVLRFSKRYVLEQVRRAGLELVVHQRGGVVFPNRTPERLRFLASLPFRVPFVGISHLVIARRPA